MKVHCYACDKIVEVKNMLEDCPNCATQKEACASALAKLAADRAGETLNCLHSKEDEEKTPALGDCLDEAKKTICGERQDVYGNPEDSFALIAEYWSTYLQQEVTAKDVAHMMVLFKMGRVQGQAPKRDNYVDICGYASIAADRLTTDRLEEMMFPNDKTW